MAWRIGLLSILGLVTLFDQLSKAWVKQHLLLGTSQAFLPGVFQLTHVRNTGVAFSLFQGMSKAWLSGSIFGLFIAFLTITLLQRKPSTLQWICLGLILGGAFGNLLDRFSMGGVTDFIDLTFVQYPVFNLADSAIVCGISILLISTILPVVLAFVKKKPLSV
jgi:signal peptidase II